MSVTIYWHRQDLRLSDNPALDYAASKEGSVLPVYIRDESLTIWHVGSAQHWWLHHSLLKLQKSYKDQGANLLLHSGKAEDILLALIKKTQAKSIVWNRCYDPQSIKRDTELKKLFIEMGLEVKTFNDSLLTEPEKVRNKSGGFF